MATMESDIKGMKLYTDVHRIYKDLAEHSYGPDDKLDVKVVSKYDCLHYHGTETVEDAINRLQISDESRVLDVGSGLGGPARWIASKTKCHVTAIEIQQDLAKIAEDLTTRCGLSDHVTHICADFLQAEPEDPGFDFLVSWLVFLHIPDKKLLFRRCNENLKPGGLMYIEDYFTRSPFTDDEKKVLASALFCNGPPSREEYVNALEEAGFIDIKFEDVTEDWSNYVQDRAEAYMTNSDRHARVYGEVTYMNQQGFYNHVAGLFKGGNVGGARILAKKSN